MTVRPANAFEEHTAVGFGAGEDGFVNFAIRILGEHGAERAVSPDWATSVANG